MKAYVPDYDVRSAVSLSEALQALAEAPGTLEPLAGGTDVMVYLASGDLPQGCFLDIRGLEELRGIDVEGDTITIGGLTTFSEIREHPTVAEELPNLAHAARQIGTVAIQNRATLASNIANGSPAADAPPALLSYGASVELVSVRGSRWVDYDAFYTGYKQMERAADELIRCVRVDRPAEGTVHHWRKVGTRRAQAISKVCLAATASRDGDLVAGCRIAFGSVAPTVLRAARTEETLAGKRLTDALIDEARRTVMTEVTPIDDVRSTADYRRGVAGNLLVEFLRRL